MVRMGQRSGPHRVLMGKSGGKGSYGRTGCRWKGVNGIDWIVLA